MTDAKEEAIRLANLKALLKAQGDSREGRLHTIKTDRGEFRFKDNKHGE